MNPVFFVTDLHGRKNRYAELFRQVRHDEPPALFIGGDLMPHFARMVATEDFFAEYLIPEFRRLRDEMGSHYPMVFIIMGNDDPAIEEEHLFLGEAEGLWHYMHNRKKAFGEFTVYGYACIPPTPFRLKDWERYDVSRYVDPGCVPPTEGSRTVDTGVDIEFATIQKDLAALAGEDDLSQAVFLFHSPPYQTLLDRAALDGMMVEHVPLDVHIGSIAIKRFMEERSPMITLHGHVHESARITGNWSEKIGDTYAFNAATDGPGLSLVRIPLNDPAAATRTLSAG
ncbi:MAG TPA: metallophosphoesterase [Bacteroidales bacterium]|nr:metallophosphoesterase [Bacteroidales bacterium]HPS61445.1 metallophosphoesterase [Bacteroidales bacterium]